MSIICCNHSYAFWLASVVSAGFENPIWELCFFLFCFLEILEYYFRAVVNDPRDVRDTFLLFSRTLNGVELWCLWKYTLASLVTVISSYCKMKLWFVCKQFSSCIQLWYHYIVCLMVGFGPFFWYILQLICFKRSNRRFFIIGICVYANPVGSCKDFSFIHWSSHGVVTLKSRGVIILQIHDSVWI